MRRPFSAVFVVTALVLAGIGSDGSAYVLQQSKAEQELIQIERDWCAAITKKDSAVLARILADDYMSVGSRGGTSTKASELANLKGPDPLSSCVNTNFKVRVYGDAAVVTGLSTQSGTNKGVAFKDRQVLWTDTFIRKDGRWQCVAGQSTLVAAQQK